MIFKSKDKGQSINYPLILISTNSNQSEKHRFDILLYTPRSYLKLLYKLLKYFEYFSTQYSNCIMINYLPITSVKINQFKTKRIPLACYINHLVMVLTIEIVSTAALSGARHK